jgi:hypothetical protein
MEGAFCYRLLSGHRSLLFSFVLSFRFAFLSRVSRVSDDGGKTVKADEEFHKLMKKAARVMNIKGHACGPEHTMIFGPTDIEGIAIEDVFVAFVVVVALAFVVVVVVVAVVAAVVVLSLPHAQGIVAWMASCTSSTLRAHCRPSIASRSTRTRRRVATSTSCCALNWCKTMRRHSIQTRLACFSSSIRTGSKAWWRYWE